MGGPPQEQPLATALVAIKSVQWNRYLSLNGQGITEYTPPLRGYVTSQAYVGPWEIFHLERYYDGSVSFRSSAFSNVYMSLDGSSVQTHVGSGSGGGEVKAQFGALAWEKYKIVRTTVTGAVAIESVAFPGRFLRLGRPDEMANVQGMALELEHFEIVVIG